MRFLLLNALAEFDLDVRGEGFFLLCHQQLTKSHRLHARKHLSYRHEERKQGKVGTKISKEHPIFSSIYFLAITNKENLNQRKNAKNHASTPKEKIIRPAMRFTQSINRSFIFFLNLAVISLKRNHHVVAPVNIPKTISMEFM